ncbi:MAG: DUF433 domain-containing protein [Raineya sp.]|nr:DUF433 domain-containing protein [Raineya sp.]MDW8295739.1 DUF433 domain-containing protein [Raineya sp.]
MKSNLLDRITLNPEICHGKPTIRNTRYMVSSILEYLAGGDSIENILAEFNDLTREDILACLQYSVEVMNTKSFELHAT